MSVKFYLAAKFGRRAEMEVYARMIEKALGWECSASWVFGGEEGLTRAAIADKDLQDVRRSDVMILFTHEYRSQQSGGGRFVEFGYALAQGKVCYVIGDRENVFMHHTSVKVYPSVDQMVRDNEVPTHG